MPDTTLLVLQHIACEPPAAYEDEMRARGVGLTRVEIDEGDELPDWHAFDGIVAMGGPMGAMDDAELPWLARERRLIADAVQADVPFWGVCLGAQLLAGSLGARVFRGPQPEVGVLPVTLEPAAATDAVFSAAPPRFPTLQWHSDSFELPDGATLLASSPAYRHQAFVWRRAYGLQFHLEVSPALAADWAAVPAYAASLEQLRGVGAAEDLVDEVKAVAADTVPIARTLFGRWLELVVGAAPDRASRTKHEPAVSAGFPTGRSS